jgi:lipid-binding SYLF domain-containing protein
MKFTLSNAVRLSHVRSVKEQFQEELDMMNRIFLAVVLTLSMASIAPAKAPDEQKVQDRLQNSGTVMHEILNIPDDIPQNLLDKARCVVVLPSVLKAAFVVGGSYGRGVLICRTGPHFEGSWGAPAMYALEGGSIGFQIGGEATDFVILVMNDRGANSLLHSKVKLGGDASAAAGPVGRTASADTDAYMRTEMLTYSRARGAFAGVSLEGASLRPDGDANAELYGKGVTATKIITEHAFHAPPQADGLIHALDHASPKLVP